MYKKLFLLIILSAIPGILLPQSNIDIYGYAQAYYTFFHNHYTPQPPEGEQNYYFNNMGIGQLNLFVTKDFGDDFSSFVNFEFINDYSSDKGFGTFNLQEAYLKWDYSDYFKLKFGMLLPQFNNLFEIYNRSPLQPYLIRPKLYNTTYGDMVNIFDILPQKALIQIYGSIPVTSVNFEYALFAGNPPNSFMSSQNNDMLPGYVAPGQSAVTYLSYGGRIGIKTGGLRVGVSTSFDVANRRNFVKSPDGQTADIGDINRYRLGSDLNFKFADFELSAEYLIVKDKISQDIQDSLNAWSALNPYFIGNSFDKTFYYATLQYNINDKWFSYVMYDYLNDKVNPFFFGLDGFYGFHIGGGYYINDSVTLKIQYNRNYARFDTGENQDPIKNYIEDNYALGVSIIF